MRTWRGRCRGMVVVVSMPEPIESLTVQDDGSLVVLTAERIRVIAAEELGCE